MEVNIQSSLQFLNLDDVDASDADYLRGVLYSLRSPTLELPWADTQDPPPADWPQLQPYDGQPNEILDAGGGGEMYPMSVPVATTMQQIYHPSVVPQIQNVTYVSSMPHPNYHHGLAQPPPVPPYQSGPPQQMYPPQMPTNRQRGSKPSPKRGGGGGAGRDGVPYNPQGPAGYAPHHSYPPPIHHVGHPFQFPNTPAPHFPTSQHAAGHPLFIAPQMTMYHPQAVFHNYAQMYPSPLAPGQPPEDMKPMDYVEKVDPVPGPTPVPPPITVPPTGPHNVYMAPPQQPPLVIEEPAVVSPPVHVKEEHQHHHVHHQTHSQQQQPQQQQQLQQPLQPQHLEPSPAPEEIEPEKPPAPVPSQVPQPPTPTSPAPVPSPTIVSSPVEKHIPLKSHPPKDAIITTAPPSLPPVKRKVTVQEDQAPQQQQPQQQQQQQQQPVPLPAPVPSAITPPAAQPSSGGKSWAGLFKSGSTSPSELGERRTFKPPQNAVAISTPPTGSVVKPHQPAHTDSVGHKDDIDPALRSLGEKLTLYKLEHKSILLTPRGLTNPSNYCYINATLQALIACPAFYNLIKVIADVKSATHSSNLQKDSKTPIIDSMVQFINEFQQSPPSWFKRTEKVKARKDSNDGSSLDILTGAPFEPTFVYKMLRKIRSEDSFHEEGRQEDAEEFLSLLLNGLNDEMLELQKLVADTPIINGEVTANGDSHDDWKEVTTRGSYTTRRAVVERTPLSDIFRGQLRSRVHRSSPEESTDSVQPFFTLQLDIESSEKVSEALEKLVEGTTIDGDANSGLMRQQQTLDELPCVLILHLKCFHYRQQSSSVSKVMKALQFPVDLRLDPKLLSTKGKANPKAKQYKLFAVVYHDGQEATKGHYLADVFHLGHSGWIRYDDAAVKLVKEEQVLDPKPPRIPYLLYYRRADTIGLQRPT